MTNIFVNLPTLWSSAKDMEQAGNSVQQSGHALSNAGSHAPSYDGQFGPWVQGIASEGNGRSKFLGVCVNQLGFRVGRKADQFYITDSGAINGLSGANAKVLKWLKENRFLLALLEIFGLDYLTEKQWQWLLRYVKFMNPSLIPFFLVLAPATIANWYGKTFGVEDKKPKEKKPTKKEPEKGKIDDKAATSKVKDKSSTKDFPLAKDAPTYDCYAYAKYQRNQKGMEMPTGKMGTPGEGLYSGEYTGEGSIKDSRGVTFKYGQEPQLGAIMVESPANSPSNHYITHGHASIVSQVTTDSTGKVTNFTISEANFNVSDSSKRSTFTWNPKTSRYENGMGSVYDCFIY